MYEAYFRLQKRPFSATPDPSCLFAPESIQQILNDLTLRVGAGQGIGVLTGGAGLGKTLICRRLAREFETRFTPILLANVDVPTRRELLQALHFEMGRRYAGEEFELRLELISSLKGLIHSGRPAILLVDEAHLLNERLLEELRTLATLSEGDEPLLRVILAGQFPLEMRLVDPALEALNQRIACHAYLEPLTRQESIDYIAFRTRWAGGDVARMFADEALEAIARICNGLPRCLNQLCDHSLLLAYVQDIPLVTVDVVNDALNDLRQLPLHWNDTVVTMAALEEPATELSDGLTAGDSAADSESVYEQASGVPSNEPTVAFEIGADFPEEVVEVGEQILSDDLSAEEAAMEEPVSMPMLAVELSTEVPLLETVGNRGRVFREEFVEDRYAVLDQRAPRLSRTFEETRLVGGARTSAIPLAPTPPQPAVAAMPPESPTDRLATEMAIEMAIGAVPEPVLEAVSEMPAAAHSLAGAYLPVDADEIEPAEATIGNIDAGGANDIEEQLGNELLDTCQQLRETIDQEWNPPAVDVRSGFQATEHPYDVVEPEDNQKGVRSTDARPAAAPQGRYVPKPNYRNVFSRLRRRIGSYPRPQERSG